MFARVFYFVYFGLLILPSEGDEGSFTGGLMQQRAALEEWADSLSVSDYNASDWRYSVMSRSISDYFHHYSGRLSEIFRQKKAKVNFVMIGKHRFPPRSLV
jgi:hypothetical protein